MVTRPLKTAHCLPPCCFSCSAWGVVLVGFFSNFNLKLSPRLLYHHLIWPFGKLLLYLGVGLFIGQAMESLGWSARFGAKVRPLVSWGRFGLGECGCFQCLFLFGNFGQYHADEFLSGRQT